MISLKKLTIYLVLAVSWVCLFSACGKENETMQNLPIESSMNTPVPANTPVGTEPPIDNKTPTVPTETPMPTETPTTHIGRHGALRVEGGNLVDQNGEQFQLYGMSTHGIAWYPEYINYESFLTLRDDWNTNCVRLAMYTQEEGGYCSDGDKDALKALVKSGIDYATELGMYVIVDWHILSDQDPNVHKEEAISFFQEISSSYADYENILYEICNEPNGYATWESVKSYAEEVIPVIRANDSDAVIIVGSPTWSQDIHLAAEAPLEYDNIMYSLHFYAGTHKDELRNRVETCVSNGLPVFISEFGMCDASGNGANDFEQASKWMELIEKYNLSFFCWNLGNRNESSSVINYNSTNTSDWTDDDLNESGKWIREYFRNKE